MLMTQTSVVVIIVFGYSNVFYRKKDSHLEFFNEFITLCCVYHYYLFTEFVPNPEVRYTIGFSLIGFTITCLVVNILVMVFGTM